MAIRVLAAVVLAALLAGCGSKSAPAKTEQAGAEKPKTKPIDGYDDIKLGQSFNEVMAAHGEQFDPYYVRQCYKDLPINGCWLATPRDGAPFRMIDGIPYRLTVMLNKFDKVTDVELKYSREGNGINGDDCRSIHERTLDWVTRDYGKLYALGDQGKNKQFRTPAGNTYFSGVPDKSGSWVSFFVRTFNGVPSAEVMKKPIGKWDNNRYVNLITTYIVAAGRHCDVDVEFSEPMSVPRSDLMRATSLDDEGSSTESTSTSAGVMHNDSYDENDAGE